MEVYWRRSYQKKTMPFSLSWGEIVFYQHSGRRVLVRTDEARFTAAKYRSIHLDWCPGWPLIIAATAWCWQTSPQTGIIATDFMWYSKASPESASTTLIIVPANSICFIDGKIHQTFNNTTKNLDLPIGVVEANYGLISKKHMKAVLRIPVLAPVCQHASSAAMVS